MLNQINLYIEKNKYFYTKTKEEVIIGPVESMSKSKKNVVDPENIINEYGADTARWFMLSDSPPERDINWSLSGINGAWKFTQKFWRTVSNCENIFNVNIQNKPDQFDQISINFRKKVHKNLKAITDSIDNFQMNVAVAKIHELTSELNIFREKSESQKWCKKEALIILLRVTEPMMPHLAEECWEKIGNHASIIETPWPQVEEQLLVDDEIVIIIQINGKKRGQLTLPNNSKESDVYLAAINLDNIKKIITPETLKNKIFIQHML